MNPIANVIRQTAHTRSYIDEIGAILLGFNCALSYPYAVRHLQNVNFSSLIADTAQNYENARFTTSYFRSVHHPSQASRTRWTVCSNEICLIMYPLNHACPRDLSIKRTSGGGCLESLELADLPVSISLFSLIVYTQFCHFPANLPYCPWDFLLCSFATAHTIGKSNPDIFFQLPYRHPTPPPRGPVGRLTSTPSVCDCPLTIMDL